MRRRDPLFEKAQKLAESDRIEFLGNGVYNVVGDHGTYTVAEEFTGKLSCNCQGYLTKGRCSHMLAVMLLTSNRRHKTHKTT
ncbi:MAG TPA: SWIM zinc finger family protein [Candidatus Sulfotelmatobacter sp.]|jgi:hypothetical protein|nr:SWIM zinc finger family protein [Candidatus Sulfotelmatobacter sp.]